VTSGRRKFLCQEENVALLREAFRVVKRMHPFDIDAFVLLSDHLHCMWTLPVGDCDFATRWLLIKSYFTRHCAAALKTLPSASRQRKREQGLWQRRYWEHRIRDEQDFARHCDYSHYNPVKHGYVTRPADWPYSTFHRYVGNGMYPLDWGIKGIQLGVDVGME
jgi:putative transposase